MYFLFDAVLTLTLLPRSLYPRLSGHPEHHRTLGNPEPHEPSKIKTSFLGYSNASLG